MAKILDLKCFDETFHQPPDAFWLAQPILEIVSNFGNSFRDLPIWFILLSRWVILLWFILLFTIVQAIHNSSAQKPWTQTIAGWTYRAFFVWNLKIENFRLWIQQNITGENIKDRIPQTWIMQYYLLLLASYLFNFESQIEFN